MPEPAFASFEGKLDASGKRFAIVVARFNAFMDAHRELFRSLEMTHCVVRTDENPWRALAMFLAERKRLK